MAERSSITSGWALETGRRAVTGQAVVVDLPVHDRALLNGRAVPPVNALQQVLLALGYQHVIVFDAVRGGRSLGRAPEALRALLDGVLGVRTQQVPGDPDEDPEIAAAQAALEDVVGPASTEGELAAQDPSQMFEQAGRLLSESTVPLAVVVDDAHLALYDPADPTARRATAHLRRCVENRRTHAAALAPHPLRNALVLLQAGSRARALELLPHAELHLLSVAAADLSERRGAWADGFRAADREPPADSILDLYGQIGELPVAEIPAAVADAARWAVDLNDPGEVMRRYQRGPGASGWESFGPELIERVRLEAATSLIGQEHVTERMIDRIVQGIYGPRLPGEPLAVLVFTGPSGTGKTLLTKLMARALLGDERRMIRFDMNSFADETSVRRFIGAEAGYIGYEQGGELVSALLAHPSCIVLFDEFDKAPPEIARVMLQLIEEGRISDGLGRTADASNAVFVFSTNFGVDGAPEGMSGEDCSAYYEQAIVEHFNPSGSAAADGGVTAAVGKPFIGRMLDVGEIVGFRPISPEMMRAVAVQAVREQEQSYQRHQLSVTIDAEAIGALAASTVTDMRELEHYGARAVRRRVRPIVAEIARYRFQHHEDTGSLHLTVVDGKPVVIPGPR